MELQGRVPVPEDDAVRLARELYGLEARARALPGEHDENFHLITADGRQLVLKVMHPARERSLVELQCAALRHLARTAPDLLLPRVVESLTGRDVSLASTRGRLVWLLTFVPGTSLAEARPRSLDLLSSVGRLLGRLSAGLAAFSHAGAERVLPWDLARAGWIRGHEGAIGDSARRGLVLRVLQEFEEEVLPRLAGLRRSVIHGDANDWNVLVAVKRAVGHEAVSVIDFGDMHRGLSVAEPAVAAAYVLLGQADPLAGRMRDARGLPRSLPHPRRRARRLLAARENAPRGERHHLGGAQGGPARRSLRDDQRSPRLGRPRSPGPHPLAARALRPARRLRPRARSGRRAPGRVAALGGTGSGEGPRRRLRAGPRLRSRGGQPLPGGRSRYGADGSR